MALGRKRQPADALQFRQREYLQPHAPRREERAAPIDRHTAHLPA